MTELRKWLDGERGRGVFLADELSVTAGAVWQWAESQVPAERIFMVSKLTKIPVNSLRPDLFPKTKPTGAGEAA